MLRPGALQVVLQAEGGGVDGAVQQGFQHEAMFTQHGFIRAHAQGRRLEQRAQFVIVADRLGGQGAGQPLRIGFFLDQAEWDDWYGGKPAREVLPGVDGQPLVQCGETRAGGSYEARMGHIAVWNAVMDAHNYLVRRWSDFLRTR